MFDTVLSENWFTVDKIDGETYVISEYRHWEETHCYLLCGDERCLLIDTGLGICNIYDEVVRLTDRPVAAAATHVHWDHIGGHRYFPEFYAHGGSWGGSAGSFRCRWRLFGRWSSTAAICRKALM